eukprot:12348026-Heterocapsa_arctica.AAC.1
MERAHTGGIAEHTGQPQRLTDFRKFISGNRRHRSDKLKVQNKIRQDSSAFYNEYRMGYNEDNKTQQK